MIFPPAIRERVPFWLGCVWLDLHQVEKHKEDEKHVHPLQLDVIERMVILRSNPGEVVLTPFMGVGSECFGAVINGRKTIGIELKESYYRQAIKNVSEGAERGRESEQCIIPGLNTPTEKAENQ